MIVPLFVGRDVLIRTRAGLLDAKAVTGGASVDMGAPRFDWDAIPLAYAMDTLTMSASWEDLPPPAAVNVGNPHVIFFVENLDAVDTARLGPIIETDPLFPARVNVNFAQVVGDNHLRLIVWERGAGLTRACGSAACAAGVSAARTGRTGRTVTVNVPGGPLLIEWRENNHVIMTGPAEWEFSGQVDPQSGGWVADEVVA